MTTTPPKPHAVGSPGYSQTLPCLPESAARARRLVRAAFATWSLTCLVENGTLIVSELVGNAVQHSGGTALTVSVTRVGPARVRIAVTDRASAVPVARVPSDDDTGGRGLLLVAALADRWHTEHRPCGKTVWAELAVRGRVV
ncbi:ATP-binding protein [Streptomyces sp. ODS05-4]|uniref:ATP-binding protein n=1 Tax=Streptomyces sp. ODS05-4 TaxID=2944939 RepID=UPI002109085D|nr:ATP-binding protein [Streptomyces sp. ODS05-4]